VAIVFPPVAEIYRLKRRPVSTMGARQPLFRRAHFLEARGRNDSLGEVIDAARSLSSGSRRAASRRIDFQRGAIKPVKPLTRCW